MFSFLITFLFIIFYNLDRIKLIILFFPFVRQQFFSDIAPVISFFLKMVSYSFNTLKLLVILTCIFNHPHIRCCCFLLPLRQMTAETHHCLILIIIYWLPSLSWSINSSAPLHMISSRLPLCKRLSNFIAHFCAVSWQLQVFGIFVDEEGFLSQYYLQVHAIFEQHEVRNISSTLNIPTNKILVNPHHNPYFNVLSEWAFSNLLHSYLQLW